MVFCLGDKNMCSSTKMTFTEFSYKSKSQCRLKKKKKIEKALYQLFRGFRTHLHDVHNSPKEMSVRYHKLNNQTLSCTETT